VTRGSYGRLPKTPDPRDYRFKASAPYTGQFVDLSDGIVQVYDQQSIGSCVAHGTSAAVDYARKKQGLAPIGPSRLFVYYQGRVRGGYPVDQDTGLEIRDGFTVISKDGAPPETDWAYDVARFTQKPPAQAYLDGVKDIAVKFGQVAPGDIDATIAAGFPVVQGFDVYESFESDAVARTGIVPMPKAGERQVGGHCTVIVSTPKDGAEIGGIPGVKYRRHLNSWSDSWGQGGYYWAPVELTAKYASDFWMVTTMDDPNGPKPPNPPEPPPFLRPWSRLLELVSRDQGVVAWSLVNHTGRTKHVAALVRASSGRVVTLTEALAVGVAIIVGAWLATWITGRFGG
jgi:C1A family cysteine protease